MKRLHRNLMVSGVVAAVGIAVGVVTLSRGKEVVEELGRPALRTLQNGNIWDNRTFAAMPTHAWPTRGGSELQSGMVNRTTIQNLTQPAWTFYIDTLIMTTPIIDDFGNIYLTPLNGMVYSLDPNGRVRWRHKLLGTTPPTAVLVDDLLVLADSLGYAYGLNLDTGKVRWVREAANQTGTDSWAVTAGSGIALFSLSDDDETNASQLIAVDAATGDERWVLSLNGTLHNVAPVFVDDGKALIFADSDAALYKLESETGKILWTVPGFNWSIPEGPAKIYRSMAGGVQLFDGMVLSLGNPSFAAGIARAHRVDTGELVWQSKKFKEHVSNSGAVGIIDGVPTFVCGYGYTPPLHLSLPTARKPFMSTLVALDARTGELRWSVKSPKWDKDIAAGQRFIEFGVPNIPNSWSAATIAGDGTVYVTWMGGIVYAVDGRDGRVISEYHTGEGGQAQPVIGHYGELVVAAGCHVMLFRECNEACKQVDNKGWLQW